MPNQSTGCLERDGFSLHHKLLDHNALSALRAGIDALAADTVAYGVRDLRRRLPVLEAVLGSAVVRESATRYLGADARPVRSILFDKTSSHNWSVPWHQDRTIAVAGKADVTGFGPWSIKDGAFHVEPPAAMLERMVTFRIHLDPAHADNGALMVLPATHAHGRLARKDVADLVRECQPITCSAEPGDVLAMRPLLLHASRRAAKPDRRRVVHVEYCAQQLPGPLAWAE